MISSAVFLGDFTAARTAFLALVPMDESSGAVVRSIRLIADDLEADPQGSWLFDVGLLGVGGQMKALAQRPLTDGFAAGVARTLSFADPLLVPRGGLLVCRLSPRGLPPPISGMSAVVEWGSLSTDKSARR